MRRSVIRSAAICAAILLCGLAVPTAQESFKPPATILSGQVLDTIRNEISGALAYNLEVMVGGTNWIRTSGEFDGVLAEAARLGEHMKQYKFDDLRVESLDRNPARKWTVATSAELWMTQPETRKIARLQEDPALVARGSDATDVEAPAVFADRRDIPRLAEMDLKGKIIVTPENSGYFGQAFEKGALGVVSYFSHAAPVDDPDQANYDLGFQMSKGKSKGFALMISPRQGYELRDMLMNGMPVKLRVHVGNEDFPFKLDSVFVAIKGTQPEKKGLMFTAHLFERPQKFGANDNISGCAVEAEVARTLAKLIADGKIPRPERSIYFLWSEEGSGTMAFFKKYPEMAGKIFGAINMDMVGENLDDNHAFFNIETPLYSKASFIDAVARNFAQYVFETNIRKHSFDAYGTGGNFPVPIVERRGSRQAFRYLVNPYEGGSDHGVFMESDAGIPALSFNVWPDLYYHTDKDLPDKSDPTQMKRVAFIAAASALAMTSGTDEVLEPLVRQAYLERLAFVQQALASAIQSVSQAPADTAHAAYKTGAENVKEAVRVSRMALGGLADLVQGRPRMEAYLAAVSGDLEAFGPVAVEQLKGMYSRVAAVRGAKPDLSLAPTPDEARLQTMIPAKVTPIALGGRFPYSEMFAALGKNQQLQMKVFSQYSASMAYETVMLANGQRSLRDIQQALTFEFGKPVAAADLEQLAKAFEEAKLVTITTAAPPPAGKKATREARRHD